VFVLVGIQNLGCSYHLVVFIFTNEHKYLFDDIFLQGDGASNIHSIVHNDVLAEVLSNVEPHYVNVDPIIIEDNELN
jgi:hypothetical protein